MTAGDTSELPALAREAIASGYYPYFVPFDNGDGATATLDGREIGLGKLQLGHTSFHARRKITRAFRARGHRQDEIRSVGAVALVPRTWFAVAGGLVRVVVVVQEGGGLRVDPGDHRTAATAVPAVRTAQRLELLTPDRRDPVPAVARRDVEHDAVDEAGRHKESPII